MTARIIDGKAVAKKLRAEYHGRLEHLVAEHGLTPGLAVILVGSNPASRLYVNNKVKACAEVGIRSERIEMPADVAEDLVLAEIDRLNADPTVHGILVQLPLPPHVGSLLAGSTIFPPCTPYGVQKLLEHENVEIAGRNVVVVGASNIVGKPVAMMLMAQDATVAICHKMTRDLAMFTLMADILVVAAGVPNLIVPQMVRTGAVVIDVGINRLPDGRVVGDVDFEGVRKKASLITPVPGGVGPMTITMLLYNTLRSAERTVGIGDPTEALLSA